LDHRSSEARANAEGRDLRSAFANDIASVACWYQTEPHAAFPKLPSKDGLEIQYAAAAVFSGADAA
jgi:hypothetical protein